MSASPSATVMPSVRRRRSRIASTARGASAVTLAASARAASMSSWAGTTSLTRPKWRASSAASCPPAIRISAATARGSSLGSRTVPTSGMIPTAGSGRKNEAWSTATTRSALMASSKPPPTAMPLTAAMIGLLRSGSSGKPPKPPAP